MAEFKQDQEVYGIHGEVLRYVAALPGGQHAVGRTYDCDNCNYASECGDSGCVYEDTADPFVVDAVFSVPPVAKKAADVAALDAEIKAKRAELQEIGLKTQDTQRLAGRAERDYAKAMERFGARTDVLNRLEALIDGKITHVVKADQAIPEILDVASLGYSGRILDIRVRGDGKPPEWRIGKSSDGYTASAILCTSLEDAEAKRNALLAENVTGRQDYGFDRLMAACDEHGVQVPADVRRRWLLDKLESARKGAETGRSRAAEAQAKLEEIKAAYDALSVGA